MLLDADARIVACNATWAAWLGVPASELLGRLWPELVSPEARAEAVEALATVRACDAEVRLELPHPAPPRRPRWLEVYLSAEPSEEPGAASGTMLLAHDRTLAQRRRIISVAHEEALALVRAGATLTAALDGLLAGLESACAEAAVALVTRGDGEPRAWTGPALPPGAADRLVAATRRLRTKSPAGERVRVMDLMTSGDLGLMQLATSWGASEVVVVDLRLANAQIAAALLVFDRHPAERDAVELELLDFAAASARSVLDAHRARTERVEGDRRVRSVLANLPGVAYRCLNDRRWSMTFISDGVLDLTGHPPEAFLREGGLSMTDLTHPDDVEPLWHQVQLALAQRQRFRVAYRLQTRNGQTKWVWEQGEGVFEDDGTLVAVEGYILDITEERRAREALRQSRENLSVLLDSIGDAVLAVDREGRVTRINPAAVQLTGWTHDAAVGHPLGEVARLTDAAGTPLWADGFAVLFESAGGGRARLLDRMDQSHAVAYTFTAVRDRHGEAVGFVLVVRDVSEQVATEEHLRQAQKMEAIGRLAGGVAHDFNNLLTGIMGYANLLVLELEGQEPLAEYAHLVLDTSRRAADLTRQLLAFSRRQPIAPAPVDVHDAVRDAVTLLRRTIDPLVSVEMELEAPWAVVSGDRAMLQSALLNIAINARDAMPQGGRLVVSTRVVDLDPATAGRRGAGLAPGLYLEIVVRDTGPGIPEADLQRIFEPFYSSKPVGKGTGLGLAAVYGTVMGHKGAVSADNHPDGGAVFTLLLPALEPDSVVRASQASEHVVRGSGRVLVADDEPVVRTLMTKMLSALGYDVVSASDGEEAVARFAADPEGFVLVVLDVQMPTMSGDEALARMAEIRPEVRALIVSGHRLDAVVAPQARAYLHKPFDFPLFSRRVADAVGAETPLGGAPGL